MSLNTYFPGVNVAPGICMGSVMVMTVFLFQASALMFSAAMPAPSAAMQHRVMIPLRVFIVIPPRSVMTFFNSRSVDQAALGRCGGLGIVRSLRFKRTSVWELHLLCQDAVCDEVSSVSCES